MVMTPNPEIMRAVERLDYRVTVGDVAAQAGLDVNTTQRGLLALASEAGGHLQVAESGEIAYLFPKDFRAILSTKYLRLRLKEAWTKIWRVLFYLIRISFGVVLIGSIALIMLTILAILLASNSSQGDRDGDPGDGFSMPRIGVFPDLWWFFYPDYSTQRSRHSRFDTKEKSSLNFLEAVFSFLFGDGDPNAELDDRRWQAIATVIRNHKGAVIAEQIAPYLDDLGTATDREYENYLLPVLTRFNGFPEVSPDGGLIYHFPDLQTTVVEQRFQPVAAYLKELPRRFSQATSGQVILATGLGGVNLVGAVVLGKMLAGGAIAAKMGGLVLWVQSIYWVLLAYGVGFLAIPLLRYFWVQWQNSKIDSRNELRQAQAIRLNEADDSLLQKIEFAQQFATETVIRQEDLAYTTEKDLVEQNIEHADKIDAEWQRRLEER